MVHIGWLWLKNKGVKWTKEHFQWEEKLGQYYTSLEDEYLYDDKFILFKISLRNTCEIICRRNTLEKKCLDQDEVKSKKKHLCYSALNKFKRFYYLKFSGFIDWLIIGINFFIPFREFLLYILMILVFTLQYESFLWLNISQNLWVTTHKGQ